MTVVLAAQVATAGQLQLNWVDTSGGQAGFRIERKASTDLSYAEVGLQNPGVTAYTDATALTGATYCYRVQAYNDAGTSGYSNEACGTVASGLVVTVSVSGTGQGMVGSSPAGINCGTDCSETYASGTLVTLSASPGTGSTFGGWNGGGCTGTDPCTITGNTPINVGATFVALPPSTAYTLSVSKSGPGTVTSTPTGVTCGSDCSESYPGGTVVTLNATPGKNARFLGWDGACTGTGTCSLVLNGTASVSAAFTRSRSPQK